MSKILMLALVFSSLSLVSCGSNTKKKTDAPKVQQISEDQGSALDLELNSDSDSGKAGPLQTVNFPFNSAKLSNATKASLDNNVAFLKENQSVAVQVEGHCDERGGIQYNLALGEKRATATRDYLVSMGIDNTRISTISFGKERPIEFGHNEGSWSKNRRANFVITAK